MTDVLLVALAWAALALPGWSVLLALRTRLRTTLGAAPAVTVLMVLFSGAVLRLVGLPWRPETAMAMWGVLFAVALAAGWFLHRWETSRDENSRDDPPARSGALWEAAPTVVALTTGALMAWRSSARMGGLGTLNGSYDSFFHIAAIQFIRRDQDGFLPTALTGIYHEPTMYPAVWDILTALLPADPISSANAMLLAMLIALPVGVATLLHTLAVSARAWQPPILVTCASVLIVPAFLSIPAMALVMGLWPFVLGTICLAPAIGALVLAIGTVRRGDAVRGILIGALVPLGAVAAHPTSAFSLAVVVIAGMIVIAVRLVSSPATRRWGLILLCAVALMLLGILVAGLGPLSSMALTRRPVTSFFDDVVAVLIDAPRLRAIRFDPIPMVAPIAAAGIGLVAGLRRRETMIQTAGVVLISAFLLSLATRIQWSWVAVWVMPWYGARERIAPLFMIALLVLVARGLAALAAHQQRSLVFGVGVGLIAASGAWALLADHRLPRMGSLAYTAYGEQLAPYVTPEEREFIEETAAELPDDAVLIGNPRDGAALYWTLGGVDTVFPTLSEPLDMHSRRVARYGFKADRDPKVCLSFNKVKPTYLYRDVSEFSGRSIAPEPSILWEGLDRIPEDKLHLVAEHGPYQLYRLDPLC